MGDFLRTVAARIRSWLRLRRVDEEFSEELSTHLDMLTREHIRRGVSIDEAHRRARLQLGGVTQLRETNRELSGLPMIETFLQDLRYALRMLRKRPGFTTVAVLTLALGIGANTAIFSVVNAIFLRPLPFRDADRIYVVRRTGNRIGGSSVSLPIFLGWQKAPGLFEHLALYGGRGAATLTGTGDAERIASAGASTELFSVLGVSPALGRDYRSEEGRPGAAHVVMLSDEVWRSRFHGDVNVLGRAITLDGDSYTIIGVLPRGFELPIPGAPHAGLWLPIPLPVTSGNPSNAGLLCLGLLKPGVTPAQAEAALTPTLTELRRAFPNMFSPEEHAYPQPLRSFVTSRAGSVPLLMFGAVTLVLLIACANVANLTLAASTGRHREIAIRTALGAGRRRIVRQLLTESVLLSAAGGAVGLATCYAFFSTIVALVPAGTPHIGEFRIDGGVLVFAFVLTIATGVLFGLAPALGASGLDLNGVLKKASPSAGSGAHSRMRHALAANEVAFTLVLLIGAALALQSLGHLMSVPPGFEPEHAVTFHVDIPVKTYATPTSRLAFFNRALASLSALPGIEQAALVNVLPFEHGGDILFSIENGTRAQPQVDRAAAAVHVASPHYFTAMRIPIERGRGLNDADKAGAAPVVVINHSLAHAYWPNRDPVGQSIWLGKPMGPQNAELAPRVIVGVVGDIREASLAEAPEPTLYIPYAQSPSASGGAFVLRTSRPGLLAVRDARTTINAIDSNLPLTNVHEMRDIVSASMVDWRFRAILLGSFGALALFIASIGVYGVISYSVANRTQEIGLRMALGAMRGDVLGLVIGQGMRTTVVGVGIGLAAAYGLTRLMTNLLFGVSATDPLTFIGVATLLVVVSAIACYVPARRAMRIDPLVALRHE